MNKNEIVDLFLKDSKVKKYLMGINDVSSQLCELISVDGFIDDFTQKESFLGLPIIKTKDIPENTIVVSCSLAIWPVTISNLLSNQGVDHISVLDLMDDDKLNIKIPFFDSFRVEYKKNKIFYKKLQKNLKDEKSKILLEDIINYRIDGDLTSMEKYSVNVKTQYFEDFLQFKDGDIFVDVGGFDGMTSLEFIKRCPNYGRVYILEPSEVNFKSVVANLENYENVSVINKGLSDKNQVLSFSDNLGSKSGINKEGDIEIKVDLLDSLVKDSVTFIKMDIEGAESDAISGSVNTILINHPILAISVYHKPDDIRKIFEQIYAIRDDYNVYLRHYTEGTDETVMFFMPAE
jgi:FkbM family methyltransferase